MSLAWKDTVATLMTLSVVGIAVAVLQGSSLPILQSWRLATLALFVIGIATCIVAGSNVTPNKDRWTVAASVLGGLAVVLLILGLIFGSKVLFMSLAATIVGLWLLTTLHHLITPGAYHA